MSRNQSNKTTLSDKQKFELCQYAHDHKKGWKEDNITLVLFPKFTLQKWWGKNRGEGRPFNKAGKFVGTMENERIAEKLRDPKAYYEKWNKTPRVELENQLDKNKREKWLDVAYCCVFLVILINY